MTPWKYAIRLARSSWFVALVELVSPNRCYIVSKPSERDYTAVFWLDASSKVKLEDDYRRIHKILLRPTRDDIDFETCVSEIRQWCQRRRARRCLFVLGRADSIEEDDSAEYISLRRKCIDYLGNIIRRHI
jgi:hypothetical protein